MHLKIVHNYTSLACKHSYTCEPGHTPLRTYIHTYIHTYAYMHRHDNDYAYFIQKNSLVSATAYCMGMCSQHTQNNLTRQHPRYHCGDVYIDSSSTRVMTATRQPIFSNHSLIINCLIICTICATF